MYMRNYLNPKTYSDNISEDNPNKKYDDDFIDYKYDRVLYVIYRING